MKLNRNHFFVIVSSLALLIVLIIQINWIQKAARIKEDLFNETARIILSRTADALCLDSAACKSIAGESTNDGKRKVDSLFQHYMQLYNIHIDYYFELRRLPSSSEADTQHLAQAEAPVNSPYTPNAYATCIGPGELKGNSLYTGPLELKLIFPDREQFLAEEMGIPFVSSVLLILLVLVVFWKTTLSLMKEKEVADRTTDFLNNMTHEFKTPLTNIALAGKMMVKDSNIGAAGKVKHYTDIILDENHKLSQQVELMLSMSALERGEIPLQETDFDLHQLILETAKCMGVQIENRQGQLNLDLLASQSLINGDRQHLSNAICGLLDNAIKYSELSPVISVKTFNEANCIVMEVSDKGIGIDGAFHEKVFDKFFRVPTGDIHNVKGFGLGLTYLKKICDLHKVAIDVESEIGQGTTFRLRFNYV